MHKIRYLPIIGLFLPLVLGITDNAWALQSHGGPEGSYVHQMAHVLFTGALLYLFWHSRKTPELSGKGWRYLQIFCVLFAAWNVLAFVGHEAFDLLTARDFTNKDTINEVLNPPLDFVKVLYYITKMDHLLVIPGLFALAISLRRFYLDALVEVKK